MCTAKLRFRNKIVTPQSLKLVRSKTKKSFIIFTINTYSGIHIRDKNLLPHIGFKRVRNISTGKPKKPNVILE